MYTKRIITVSFAFPDQFWKWADEVTFLPAEVPVDDSRKARKIAIKKAMTAAVLSAAPGDVIAQDDIDFVADPFDTPLEAGKVTMLTPMKNPSHWCPRAFRLGDRDVAFAVAKSWEESDLQTCYSWGGIPKLCSICGVHRD